MNNPFELYLFSVDPEVVAQACDAGVDGFVVDWEVHGKADRQRDADTDISLHTADDLRRVRAATRARVLCRLNMSGPNTRREIETACDAGADEVLLPMVRTAAEVHDALERLRGRVPLGILIENAAAVSIADELARLPLSRVFLGLNDLAIDRGSNTLFSAVADGTVEHVRSRFPDLSFGFGGLTHPDCGAPVPCRLLLAEMLRLRCRFSFLRRSFLRDVPPPSFASAVAAIRAAIAEAVARPATAVEADCAALRRLLAEQGDS